MEKSYRGRISIIGEIAYICTLALYSCVKSGVCVSVFECKVVFMLLICSAIIF